MPLRSYIKQPKGLWTKEQIRLGFLEFVKEFGRYPTAVDIDRYEYLPSSRSLQRTYGGLVAVRQEFFPGEIDNFTRGEYRSKVASNTFKRAQVDEARFYDKLCTYLEPISVHEHKVIRPGGVTCDFFLYENDTDGVCIDIFYASDISSFAGVVNYKVRHYSKLNCRVVLVIVNAALTESVVKALVDNKKNEVPEHISIYTESYFWKEYMSKFCKESQFAKI